MIVLKEPNTISKWCLPHPRDLEALRHSVRWGGADRSPVLTLLAAARRERGNPDVCLGEKGGHHFVGLPRVWQRIRRHAGLEGVRLHDLRHTHASSAAGLGTPLQIIGALLGHSGPQTTARYAHLADSPVRAAANEGPTASPRSWMASRAERWFPSRSHEARRAAP